MNPENQYPKQIADPEPNAEAQAHAEAYIEEHALTPEKRRASELREKNLRQELTDFELTTAFVDEYGER